LEGLESNEAPERPALDVSVSTSKEPERIAGMFDQIAWQYDRLNHLLSGGLDRRWRRQAIRQLQLEEDDRVLDVCTGTADLALEAAICSRRVVGVDFSSAMLQLGLRKIREAAVGDRVSLARGDAMALPFADGIFDAATIGFGIRNVADPVAGCRELRRVLRPGGRIAILEFGMPRARLLASGYRWYSRHILSRVGRAISRHRDAYDYLPASIETFPHGEAFVTLLRQAGFPRARFVPLVFGTVCLYLGARD
jgi:demethylmenaquinone methyltransferase/2-methoxy-6-polyprenyl-1,4-benzoquinol methylase